MIKNNNSIVSDKGQTFLSKGFEKAKIAKGLFNMVVIRGIMRESEGKGHERIQ